jgi:predicted ATP-grasp superfamily ATP-dependent carboligase
MQLFLTDESAPLPVGGVVVVAFPSAGNVGQMAMDQLLATLGQEAARVGSIESCHLLPISGYDRQYPGAPMRLCLPAEIYVWTKQGSEQTPLVMIQVRRLILNSE